MTRKNRLNSLVEPTRTPGRSLATSSTADISLPPGLGGAPGTPTSLNLPRVFADRHHSVEVIRRSPGLAGLGCTSTEPASEDRDRAGRCHVAIWSFQRNSSAPRRTPGYQPRLVHPAPTFSVLHAALLRLGQPTA